MIQLIFLIIAGYIVVGAIGMYLGNKKVNKTTGRQRWFKLCFYVFITGIVLVLTWLGLFFPLCILIAIPGYYELLRTIYLKKKAAIIAIVFYSLFVAGLIYFSIRSSKEFQLLFYFQVLTFDAFCQITGQLIGRTALAPKISPAKTSEGLAGGIFFCILSTVLVAQTLNLPTIFLGFITAVFAFTGDLLASKYKRIAGIKDYSNLLPGQGGFLDRFDSMIMAGFGYGVLYFIDHKIFSVLLNG
jgi:phosphatidate cytidylyltransferase